MKCYIKLQKVNYSSMNEDSDYEAISSIDAVNSLFDDINQDFFSTKINRNLNDMNNLLDDNNIKKESNSDSKSTCQKITNIILFPFLFLIIVISHLFFFVSNIAIFLEIGISFYSVIILNYVFFISSIVSYSMTPIYQSLSHDWINFGFSFMQVILASPLIAFYIFYVIKTVISLASYISEIPNIIKQLFYILKGSFDDLFFVSLSDFCCNFANDLWDINFEIAFLYLGTSLLFLILASLFAYVLFCFDKTIIFLGIIYYLINTFQIIIIIYPSYEYFFQTLFNRKCKENEIVNLFIKKCSELINGFPNRFHEFLQISLDEDSSITEPISDDVDSIEKINYDETQFNDENDEDVIDDPYIENYVHDHKEIENKLVAILYMFFQILSADSYYSLYYYSKTIAFDKHKKCIKIVLMHIFFLLNLAVIAYDIYKLTQNYSGYFLASIIIRFLIVPLLSYYNMIILILYKPKDSSLKVVLNISSIFTIIITIIIIFCYAFTGIYRSKYRINNLEFVPILNNFSIANKKMLVHPICNYDIYNVSPIDAFGYSLGGYDIKRNKNVFDNQMKTFFGENFSSHISYKLHELDEYFLFIEYFDSLIDTHIFAFRGYNSGPEFAFQLEALATQYIIPFFEDNVPFYGTINNYWLEFYTDFLNSFGLNFFENDNIMVKYVNEIIDIYNKENLDNESVLFAGINSGGIIAKIVGSLLKCKSISFVSLPIDNDLFNNMFDLDSSYLSLITNVYNVDGFFSSQEPNYATNIGIEIPVFDRKKYCTSGICNIKSKTDNVYRTFCTISEICGRGNQFNYYCENIIGKKDIETIHQSLEEND